MENKNISPMLTSSASVREALGIMNDPQSTPEDRQNSQQILRNVGRAKVREIKKQMMRTGDYATPEPGLKKGGKVSSKKMAMGGPMSKKSKGISEYGGMEKYPSKASMLKHEKSEAPVMEKKEEKMYMQNMGKKMAMGGKVGRGCGSAMRGGGSVMKYGKKGM